MQVMLAVVTAAALIGGGTMAIDATSNASPVMEASYLTDQAQLTPQRIVIGIDLSKSNPHAMLSPFNLRVSAGSLCRCLRHCSRQFPCDRASKRQ